MNKIINSGDKLTILDKRNLTKKFIITDDDVIDLRKQHDHIFNKEDFCTICLLTEAEITTLELNKFLDNLNQEFENIEIKD